jgi:ADP-heptose:LPS heptosyltransferase
VQKVLTLILHQLSQWFNKPIKAKGLAKGLRHYFKHGVLVAFTVSVDGKPLRLTKQALKPSSVALATPLPTAGPMSPPASVNNQSARLMSSKVLAPLAQPSTPAPKTPTASGTSRQATILPFKALQQDAIVLIYPDLLGDYILIREHLRSVSATLKAQGKTLYYVGNVSLKPLIQFLDPDLADRFYWIHNFTDFLLTPKKLLKWPILAKQWQQQRKAMGLPSHAAEVWCPSTGPWVVNGLVHAIKAKRKLGKDMESRSLHVLQQLTNTHLYQPEHFLAFNTHQHQQFFEMAMGQHVAPASLVFPKERFKGVYQHPALDTAPYCVIFTDTSTALKEWPVQHFAQVISYILKHSPLNVVLCGHHSKSYQAEAIIQHLNHDPRIINLMGNTSIVEVFDVIGRGQFVICNDSFALHAANAMAKPVICITQGLFTQANQSGRYLPYPPQYRHSVHTYLFSQTGSSLASVLPIQVYPHIDKLLACVTTP